ncbi:hypothetical protein [Thalassotalea sp. PS06]|uniref:hypothetical protein n=1 Tax=Thalassotalea sp. PS06 TaxID=2594005 RepID=UPI00116232C3|nr:hypothetical protein [Thalassotalea sp. PS06]QDP00849.1 hypothetical protein FNC98_05495 [Thalassotalea sp. PS06]
MTGKNLWNCLVGLIVAVACVAFGYSTIPDTDDVENPIYSITFKISPTTRNVFYSRIEAFAEANAFAIRSAPTRPNSDSSLTQLWREDIKIIGVNPFDPNVYNFHFYNNDSVPVNPKSLSYLVQEIKAVVKNLKGASFEEQ